MIDFSALLTEAGINIITGLTKNIFYILLFLWGVNKLDRKIESLIKNIPIWLKEYEEILQRSKMRDYARGIRQ